MLPFFFIHSVSWWGHAHRMIGRIAEIFLSSSELKKFNKIIQSYQYPLQTITECATWQDDLKDNYGVRTFYQWHFSDETFIDGDCSNCAIMEPTYNITSYLKSAIKTLTNPTTTSVWAWAFHIRSIVHFVGDVHMPLHNTARYNNDFPEGDKGGNLYTLNCNYGSSCSNVHALWDSVGNLFNINNPLIPIFRNGFQENVTNLIKEFPKSAYDYDLETFNPDQWHNESFELSKQYVYQTPKDQWPSSSYFSQSQQIAKKRVVAAGYRLGHFLKSVAGNLPIDNDNYTREIIAWIINGILLILSVVFAVLSTRKTDTYSRLGLTA